MYSNTNVIWYNTVVPDVESVLLSEWAGLLEETCGKQTPPRHFFGDSQECINITTAQGCQVPKAGVHILGPVDSYERNCLWYT